MYAVAVLLVFQISTSLHAFPVYIPYANEVWGGPSQTYKLPSDSNADWGEQLKATKKYLDQRGVKDCWFVYFDEGVVDYSYYGIPCKALPTPDAMWVNEKFYPPAEIDGPVLINAANLSGFEYGAGELNPYEQFKSLTPTAVIAHEVFVYDGHFAIPNAAAIGHAQKSSRLAGSQTTASGGGGSTASGSAGSECGQPECGARRCADRNGAKRRSAGVVREGADAGADG
jgi:hypothetical protein